MAIQLPTGRQQFFDDTGNPLDGGTVNFYAPGTTTPVNTYQDSGLTTLNSNPVILDSAGRCSCWTAEGVQVRQMVYDSLGNLIWDQVTGWSGEIQSGGGPVVVNPPGSGIVDNTYNGALILVTSATPTTLTIHKQIGASDDWVTDQYFSVMQLGAGSVTLAIQDAAGTLYPSPGFVSTTRGVNSIISATCIYADSNSWAVSGDLLISGLPANLQSFTLPCSDEATTNIAVATNVYRFQMPYAILVTNVRAILNVAQSAGSLLTVDITLNGTSIFSTLLSIDNTETTSTTAATPYVLVAPTSTVLSDGALIAINVTQVGTAGARGLKVQLIGSPA